MVEGCYHTSTTISTKWLLGRIELSKHRIGSFPQRVHPSITLVFLSWYGRRGGLKSREVCCLSPTTREHCWTLFGNLKLTLHAFLYPMHPLLRIRPTRNCQRKRHSEYAWWPRCDATLLAVCVTLRTFHTHSDASWPTAFSLVVFGMKWFHLSCALLVVVLWVS